MRCFHRAEGFVPTKLPRLTRQSACALASFVKWTNESPESIEISWVAFECGSTAFLLAWRETAGTARAIGQSSLTRETGMHIDVNHSATQDARAVAGKPPARTNINRAVAATDGQMLVAAPAFAEAEDIDPAELAARRRLAMGVSPAARPHACDEDAMATAGGSAPMLAGDPEGVPPVGYNGSSSSAQNIEPVRRADDQAGSRPGPSSVFEHVDALLKDIERSKATLSQRTAALTAEREAHHEVKMRLKLLGVEQERVVSEYSAQQTELERLSTRATELEGTVSLLQQTLLEKTRLKPLDHIKIFG